MHCRYSTRFKLKSFSSIRKHSNWCVTSKIHTSDRRIHPLRQLGSISSLHFTLPPLLFTEHTYSKHNATSIPRDLPYPILYHPLSSSPSSSHVYSAPHPRPRQAGDRLRGRFPPVLNSQSSSSSTTLLEPQAPFDPNLNLPTLNHPLTTFKSLH